MIETRVIVACAERAVETADQEAFITGLRCG
jgi:hypothetical protein